MLGRLVIADKTSFCYLKVMSNPSGISKLAGRVGMLLMLLGLAAFFIGIFGGPRTFAFAGVGMMVLSIVGFAVEEFGPSASKA